MLIFQIYVNDSIISVYGDKYIITDYLTIKYGDFVICTFLLNDVDQVLLYDPDPDNDKIIYKKGVI